MNSEGEKRKKIKTFVFFLLGKLQLILNIKKKKPYLKTTTSKLVENTKAFELTIIKELGKLTP